jgi:hypothetical protein
MIAALALQPVQAFTAPAVRAPTRSSAVTMFSEGDLGVLPPLGACQTRRGGCRQTPYRVRLLLVLASHGLGC